MMIRMNTCLPLHVIEESDGDCTRQVRGRTDYGWTGDSQKSGSMAEL